MTRFTAAALIGGLLLILPACTPWLDNVADPTTTVVSIRPELIGDIFLELRGQRACSALLQEQDWCVIAYLRFSGSDTPIAICVHDDGAGFSLPDATVDMRVGSRCEPGGTITAIVGGT